MGGLITRTWRFTYKDDEYVVSLHHHLILGYKTIYLNWEQVDQTSNQYFDIGGTFTIKGNLKFNKIITINN